MNYKNNLPSIIRLCFVSLVEYRKGLLYNKVSQTYVYSRPFELPNGMSLSEALKVISYLSEKVENGNNIEPASIESVVMVSKMLDAFGFKKVNGYHHGYSHTTSERPITKKVKTNFPYERDIDGVVDLFTVDGDLELFRNSDLGEKYFNWFIEGVTSEDVKKIYKNTKNKGLDSFKTETEATK